MKAKIKTLKEVAQAWVDAYNARDPYALVELYHEDAEVIQVASGEHLRGHAALLENFESFFDAFPDNFTHIENLFECGDWVVLEWRGGGTFTGALERHAPTGKSFTLRGCGCFHILEGKIRFQRGYFDRLTWFEQIGIPVE